MAPGCLHTAHDHTQAMPERTTPTLAHRMPWSRVHEHAPARLDDRVPSPLTAWSLSRRPSRPKSLTPHGPYRLDPDRAAPVCGADSALVNASPFPATSDGMGSMHRRPRADKACVAGSSARSSSPACGNRKCFSPTAWRPRSAATGRDQKRQAGGRGSGEEFPFPQSSLGHYSYLIWAATEKITARGSQVEIYMGCGSSILSGWSSRDASPRMCTSSSATHLSSVHRGGADVH
jgi:hypothetical protein